MQQSFKNKAYTIWNNWNALWIFIQLLHCFNTKFLVQ